MAAPVSSWLKAQKKLVHIRIKFLGLLYIDLKVTGRERTDLLYNMKTVSGILLLLKRFIGQGDPAEQKQ